VEELLMSAAKGSRFSGRPAWGAGWLEALLDFDCDDPVPIQRNHRTCSTPCNAERSRL